MERRIISVNTVVEIWEEQQHLVKLFPTLEYNALSRHMLAFICSVKSYFNRAYFVSKRKYSLAISLESFHVKRRIYLF